MSEADLKKSYVNGEMYEIKVKDFVNNDDQPRKEFDPKTLESLTNSIEKYGLLGSIVFSQDENDDLYVVAGERRLRAARHAGLEKIHARFTDKDQQEIALVENSQREDLTPVEFAEALNFYMVDNELKPEDLMSLTGKKKSSISEILSIYKLPIEIRNDCRGNRKMPQQVLVKIAKKKSNEEMNQAYEEYKAKHAGNKIEKVHPWPVRIISNCEKINSIMKISGIGPLDAETRKSVIEHLEELQAETETLLQRLRQETTSEEGGGAGQNQPQG